MGVWGAQRASDVAREKSGLPSMHEALGSVPSTNKWKGRKKHEAMGKENMRGRRRRMFLGQSEDKGPDCTYFPLAFDWLTR